MSEPKCARAVLFLKSSQLLLPMNLLRISSWFQYVAVISKQLKIISKQLKIICWLFQIIIDCKFHLKFRISVEVSSTWKFWDCGLFRVTYILKIGQVG